MLHFTEILLNYRLHFNFAEHGNHVNVVRAQIQQMAPAELIWRNDLQLTEI